MNRSSAYISILLCIVLVFASAGVAFGATQSELDEARRKASSAREAAAAAEELAEKLRKETEALDSQISELQSAVNELQPEIDAATDRTKRLRSEVESLRGQIAELEGEIEKTQAEFDKQQSLLNDRMATSYRQGNLFYLDMLLSAKDFNDLIARTTLVQRVIESNQDIAITLDDTKQDLQSTKGELDRTLENVAIKKAEAEAVEKDLKRLQASRKSKVNEQTAAQSQKSFLMQAAEKDKEKYLELAKAEEAAAAQIAAQLRGGGSGSSSGGGQYAGDDDVAGAGWQRDIGIRLARAPDLRHQEVPSRHRHQQGRRHGRRCRQRDRHQGLVRLGWRLRKPDLRRSRRRCRDDLQPPCRRQLQGLQRSDRERWAGDSECRVYRLLHRTPPALRGPAQR